MSPTRRTTESCALHPKSWRLDWRGVGALLFDLDGTLVAPTIDFGELNQAVRDVVCAYGASEALTEPMPALEMIDTAAHWLLARGRLGAEALRADGQRAILAVELAAASKALPFDGVPAMMTALARRGLRLGIVTRNSREAAALIVAQGGLTCDVLLSRDDVPLVKPDPAHLHAALAHLGVAAEQALMCGDHPMDMVAAKRAGAGAVGVLTGGATAASLTEAGADLVLACITALPDLLDVAEDAT